ncbi:hypothetical protein GGS23DRAFT_619486 [Durotheca rogersii]|uniref:uncharacterized protein n=1 Tax=Durotheca rogersii TaxID=419775 RepID=UPI00221E5D0F|nr:uncharacterized protein GGS23DRAFT_619486 [Durotheca rogersii]KAI5864833.1 hypothetical protein GGS23DRAFT_619486 [Durotheca rogersii]
MISTRQITDGRNEIAWAQAISEPPATNTPEVLSADEEERQPTSGASTVSSGSSEGASSEADSKDDSDEPPPRPSASEESDRPERGAYAYACGEVSPEDLASPETFRNELVEVRASPLGGNGVFARRALRRGELVLAERPVFRASPNSLYRQLDGLAPDVRAAYDRMVGHRPSRGVDRRQAIFMTNSFVVGTQSYVYLVAARFNHACAPARSVDYRPVPASASPPGGRVLEFRMARDVEAGAELTISYGLLTPRNLYVRWGFRCACGACQPLADEEVAQIDSLRDGNGDDDDDDSSESW